MKLKRKLLNTTMLRQPGREGRRGESKERERGRSMVEMLGVLAVIGVLTIGGIAGYRLSMNKYRASQAAGEINIMKEELRIQMLNGNQQVTLGEPYDKEEAGEGELKSYPYEVSYGCGEGEYTYSECQGTENYYIEVRGVEKRICQPLSELLSHIPEKKTLKINGKEEGCEEEENTLILVMNKEDGGRGNESSDAGDNPNCSAGLTGRNCDICENGNVYLSYMDNPCDTKTEMNKKTCTKARDCGYIGVCCVDNRCVAGEWDGSLRKTICEQERGECLNNGDCKGGEYCNLSGTNCTKPETGTCTSITGKRDMTVNGRKFRLSTGYMSWWGADNWCRAQGMRLVSLSDVECEVNYGQKCTSETLSGLRTEGLNSYFWTSSAVNSCFAYLINDDGHITDVERNNYYDYASIALCIGS